MLFFTQCQYYACLVQDLRVPFDSQGGPYSCNKVLRNRADHTMKMRFAVALLVERDLPFEGHRKQLSTPSPLLAGGRESNFTSDGSQQPDLMGDRGISFPDGW
jgi:hypothetical protein